LALPTGGAKILTRYLESWYVGDYNDFSWRDWFIDFGEGILKGKVAV